MALDRLFGQLIDIARTLAGEGTPEIPRERPSVPPTLDANEPVVDARLATAPGTVPAAAVAESVDAGSEPPEAEPIVSVPMARVLIAQGHARRALAMYETLLVRRPNDAALAREVEEARAAALAPAKKAVVEDDGLAGEDEIVAVRASDRDVLLSWQVGQERIARGKRLLPEAGEMAVRLVLFHRGEGAAIRREERERIVERAGEWLVADVPRDAWMTASIGLRHHGRFVSLTHSAATRTP